MGYDSQFIFTRLGKQVKKFNAISELPDGIRAALDKIVEDAAAAFNDSPEDRKILNMLASANRSDQSACDAMAAQAVSIAAAVLSGDTAERLGAVGTNAADVLELLADAMEDASDTVLETSPVAAAPVYDGDNAGNGTLSEITLDQLVRDCNHFEIECVDDSDAGEERWRVTSSRLGYVGEAVTGEEFDAFADNAAGNVESGVKFTIEAATGSGAEDWETGDKIRFSTFVSPSFAVAGDNHNTFSDWIFFGVKPGYNTDADGKLYATVEDNPGSPATYTVNVYKDSGKTALVASATADEAECEILLAEQNGSGLSIGVDMDYTYDDSDIVVTFTNQPRFQFFLVENFGKALPSAASGANTVDEALAE
jgi:hypothetical protein